MQGNSVCQMKASLFASVGLKPFESFPIKWKEGWAGRGRNDGCLDLVAYEESTYSLFQAKSTLLQMHSLWPLRVIATLSFSENVKFGLLSIKQLSDFIHTHLWRKEKECDGTTYGSLLGTLPAMIHKSFSNSIMTHISIRVLKNYLGNADVLMSFLTSTFTHLQNKL